LENGQSGKKENIVVKFGERAGGYLLIPARGGVRHEQSKKEEDIWGRGGKKSFGSLQY